MLRKSVPSIATEVSSGKLIGYSIANTSVAWRYVKFLNTYFINFCKIYMVSFLK